MRRLWLLVLGALVVGAAVWFLVRPGEGPSAGPRTSAASPARNPEEAAPSGPLLTGSGSRSDAPAPTARADAAAAADTTVPAPAAPDAEELAPIDALVERIQREVEPLAWQPPSEAAIKAQGGRMLVVRAARAVQEGIYEYLGRLLEEARRRRSVDADAEPAAAATDPSEREQGEEDLRRLLRGMLLRWKRLNAAMGARTASRTHDAVRMLDDVLAEEADHEVARAYRQVLLEPAPAKSPTGDRDSAGHGVELDTGPIEEVEARIRALTPYRIASWVMAWPSRTTFAALERARRRARMEHWTLRGAERDRRLALPAPRMDLAGLDLLEALQRLSFETLIDCTVEPHVLIPLRDRTLRLLAPTDGTLDALLQAIAYAVGPHLRFRPYPTVLELSAEGQPPRTEVRIFDVSDLLEEDAPSPR